MGARSVGRTSLRRVVAATAVIVTGASVMLAAAAPANAATGSITTLSNPSPDPYGLSSQGLAAENEGPQPPTALNQVIGTVGGVIQSPLGFPNLGGYAGTQFTVDSPLDSANQLVWKVTSGPDDLPVIPGVLGTPFEAGGTCGTIKQGTFPNAPQPIFPYTTIDATHPLCIFNQGGLPLIEAYGGTDTITVFVDKNGNGTLDTGEPSQVVHVTYTNEPKTITITPAAATFQTGQCNTIATAAGDAPNSLILGLPNLLNPLLKMDPGGRPVPGWQLHVQVTQTPPNGQAAPANLHFCNQFVGQDATGQTATSISGSVTTGGRGEAAPIGIYTDALYPISVQTWWDANPDQKIESSSTIPGVPLCTLALPVPQTPTLLSCAEPASPVSTYTVVKGGADGVKHLTITTDSPNAFTGSPVNGTITLSNDIGPSVNVTPIVTVTGVNGGTNGTQLIVQPTDAHGKTRFSYTPTSGGTDVVTAFVQQTLGGTPGMDPSEPQGSVTVNVTLTPTNVSVALSARGSLAGGQLAVDAGRVGSGIGDAQHSILPTSQDTETYTAKVTDTTGSQLPRQGVAVTFAIPTNQGRVSGGNVGSTSANDGVLSLASAITNSNGIATVTLTDPNPVAGDAFHVIATVGGTTVADSAYELYQAPTIAPTPDSTNGALGTSFPTTTGIVTVDPSIVVTKVGTAQNFTATVKDQFGNAKQGVTTFFSVTQGRNACTQCLGSDLKQGTTDSNGKTSVALTDTSQAPLSNGNVDTVNIAADMDGNPATNGDQAVTTATRYYTAGDPLAAAAEGGIGTGTPQFGPAPSYAPNTSDNSGSVRIDYQHAVPAQTPTDVFFTARTADGVTLYGRTIQVTSSGVGALVDPNGNLAQLSGETATVGSDGYAHFKVLSTHAGTETLTAVMDAQTIQITINWYDQGGQRNLSLTPSSASAIKGATTTVTATAIDVYGNPVQGAPITFSIAGPGTFSDGSTTTSGSTASDGTLLVRVISTAVGTTTLTASTTGTEVAKAVNDPFDGASVANSSTTATITTAPPTPASDATTTLTFSPSSNAAINGTINAIGTVKDANGAVLVGKRVSMTVAGVVGDQNNNLVTNSNGQVSFSITSSRAGTGTVTMKVFASDSTVEVAKQGNITFGGSGLYPKPVLTQSNGGGSVTLSFKVDPHYVGYTVYFFRRSGMTGQVVPLGTAQVNTYGYGYRTFMARSGQILALYGKIVGASDISDSYSNSVQFKVR